MTISQINAQLLEDGQGKLKSIKTGRPGFLYFPEKISSGSPGKTKKIKPQKIKIRSTSPASYNKKTKTVSPRSSTPVSYNKNDRPVVPRTSFPVSYNKKEQKVKVRTSKPQKETFFNFWITQQLKSKNRIGPTPDVFSLFGKSKFSFVPSGYKRPGPLEDPRNLYNRSKLSLRSTTPIFGKKFSISGPMNFQMNKRLVDMYRPGNDYTSSYKGDIKRDRNPILHLKYRFGQWERASYRGHHVAWNKSAKMSHARFNSQTVSKFPGDQVVLVPFLAKISEKMKRWEQTHYQGRSVGLSKFGQRDYERALSLFVSNYEGDIKVKRRKGKDMHPSISYISGKRFSNLNWKERWRKLNILWVRVNPGKETPGGAKEKYKEKYDKDERDIWTY